MRSVGDFWSGSLSNCIVWLVMFVMDTGVLWSALSRRVCVLDLVFVGGMVWCWLGVVWLSVVKIASTPRRMWWYALSISDLACDVSLTHSWGPGVCRVCKRVVRACRSSMDCLAYARWCCGFGALRASARDFIVVCALVSSSVVSLVA